MFFTLRLMNDTIVMTIILTAVPMVLHRTMMFRGSLFDTRHSVDSGCGVMDIITSWKSSFELDV